MAPPSYRLLDGELVLKTIRALGSRITERFPGSGLSGVCRDLEGMAARAIVDAPDLLKPILRLRLVVWFAGLLLAAAAILFVASLREVRFEGGLGTMLQTIEAGINDVIFLGVAVVFLRGMEGRAKRKKTLAAVHELRSLVHIVDMHQLTKDPEIVLEEHTPTASSPKRPMGRFELARYLDYCSEMLSLSGKVAALYVQYLDDPVVLSAVTEVETLATGISGKIWQKIVILDTVASKS